MKRPAGVLGISMGTLVKYEHVSGDLGNMQLGQRVYHIDAYWQWNQQEATQLPEAMVVGYAAGWSRAPVRSTRSRISST